MVTQEYTTLTMRGTKSSQTYYARVPDRVNAIEAVRKHIRAMPDTVIEARKPLQATVWTH